MRFTWSWSPAQGDGARFRAESFGQGPHWHRFVLIGRLTIHVRTARP